ncbi:MAG: 3'-5' exonuclease [Kiritimatiellae bacterium]|nr:3'-5' exonuclease [Kiritimatiellia bacterium]
MLRGIKLKRPLAFIDIEATGTRPRDDRIIEVAVVKIGVQGSRESYSWRVNPGKPIPPEATLVHGIRDEDVAGCPSFAEVAPEIARVLEGCDLAGYNILRFDLPMLVEEFSRSNMSFEVMNRYILDVQRIFHKKEPRDLAAALAYYCGEMYLNAHTAKGDAEAALRVFEGQLAKYSDLPRTLEELDRYCNPRDPSWVDRTGRLRWENGEIVVNFGQKKGMPLKKVLEKDRDYVKWFMRNDFPPDVREIVKNAMAGKWPAPPTASQESSAPSDLDRET